MKSLNQAYVLSSRQVRKPGVLGLLGFPVGRECLRRLGGARKMCPGCLFFQLLHVFYVEHLGLFRNMIVIINFFTPSNHF